MMVARSPNTIDCDVRRNRFVDVHPGLGVWRLVEEERWKGNCSSMRWSERDDDLWAVR